jgi:hypothetical protein
MKGNGYDYRVSLPRLSGTSKNLPRGVVAALAAADRSPGWNNRPRDVQRFELGACLLFVVPFRCWAYRRQEQRAAALWRECAS